MARLSSIFGFSALAFLIACQIGASEYPNGWQPKDERACRQAGGKIARGMAGPACAMPTDDAGMACTDGSTCEGRLCLANGQCVPQTQNFGCIDILQGGKPVTICID